ncbi:MAG: DUF3108 domain-containing protein [Dehalococcoidia bacterium]|nr:DUF3108 domain-containing protein [Dehalococcoidia bacterium]
MTITLRSFPALRMASMLVALLTAAVLLGACAGASTSSETVDVFVGSPFEGGESLRYEVVDIGGGDRVLVGYGTLAADAEDGRLALRQTYVEAETPDGATPVTDEVVVWVQPDTFRPLGGERTVVSRDGNGRSETTRYAWSYVAGGGEDKEPRLVVSRDGGDERSLRLRDHYYDNESSLWLWRSIDLVEEYEAYYVSANPVERNQQAVNIRVPQIETVTVPAGEFEAYRLLFRTGRAVRTAWIEAAAPHRVLRWDNGQSVLELLPDE